MIEHKNIVITGTKGKTTVAYLVDQLLMGLRKDTIRVDTTGHFVNGKRKSTLEESKAIWGLVPTVCPGRFLWELKTFSEERRKNTVAILESSLGSSNSPGIGIKRHQVGVWTNVLEDHLNSTDRLKTRADIADAKDFVFKRIEDNGFAVFNACDKLVCSKTDCIIKTCAKIPVVFNDNETFFDIDNHFKMGGTAFVLEKTKIYKQDLSHKELVYDALNLPWVFHGYFTPSLINLTFAIATIYATFEGDIPNNLASILDAIRLDPYGGRLTVFDTEKGTMVIADYAHEKESLVAVGKLARRLARERGGQTIGVVRLAYDRTDDLIDKTGRAVGEAFDRLVVYDKIDGYWRKPIPLPSTSRFTQEVGKISGKLGAAIKKKNEHVTIILREDEALEFAAKEAEPNDVVIVIVNDNITRSIDWIKEKFRANFA